MTTAPKIHLTVEGTEYVMDPTRFMFSEVVLLEDQCGIRAADMTDQLFSKSPPVRAIGAMVWLVQLRARAEATGTGIAACAEAMPFAGFDFNLGGMEVRAVTQPENPTPPATRTPATRTTRATSKRKPAKTGTASSD